MRIGILTFIEADNYGAVLQAYALQAYIQSLGHKCKIIRYRNRNIWIQFHNRTISECDSLAQYIKSHLRIAINKKRQKNFDEFRDSLPLTEVIDSNSFNEIENQFDKIIVGSDQVWNPWNTSADRNFLLEFIKDNSKKLAYAASFGNIGLFTEFGNDAITLLQSFAHISVREIEGKEYLSQYGIKSKVVADPVLLLKMDEWESLCGKVENKDNYIFVYQLRPIEEIAKFATKLSENTGLKVYALPYLPTSRRFYNKSNMVDIYDSGPKEFIKYIMGARYVVTDSFHGMALSICMHKDFYVYSDQGKMNTSSRINSLLNICEINSRFINNFQGKYVYTDIDYSNAENKLEHLRNISREYLIESLIDEDKNE